MGTWGTGIFQNDIADDVRHDYKNKLKIGRTDEQALSEIIAENTDFINDSDDCFDFWFGLASTMYDLGRLTDDVRAKATELIDGGKDAERWETAKEAGKRAAQLAELRTKLMSEQPERKKISVKKPFDTKWNINDIFLYHNESVNKYVWLAVDRICTYDAETEGLGDKLAVTYLKISDSFSGNVQEVDKASFILHYYAMGSDIPEYRFLWYKTGFREAASRFRLIGNYNFARPDKFYPYTDREPEVRFADHWYRLDEFIERSINR